MVTSDELEGRIEKARKHLLEALNDLRSAGVLTPKEADAVEAAIEDELIALRIGKLLSDANPKP
jgi:hypothetical protein